MSYDICVIGGGPGGYSAAIRGAQMGGKVALVEKESLGGTCLNHGCIPTKNLYAVSEFIRKCGESENYGIKIGKLKYNFAEIQERKNESVDHLKKGLYKLFKDHKIDVVSGKGSVEGIGRVRVDRPEGTQIIDAKSIIIATGSEASDIPPLRIDGSLVLGNREILALEEVPASLAIIGGGPIGCEFANIFSRLGTRVTVVEVMDRLLPYCEKEISRLIKKRFEERGIEVILGRGVKSAESEVDGVEIRLVDDTPVAADKVLMSVGRRLNSFDLGLDDVELDMDGAVIKVNDAMETSVKGIYAIGDVSGNMALAHVAAGEGKVAAENSMGKKSQMDCSAIPWAVYIYPEIASVGKGEEALKEEGVEYKVGRFPYIANGKALGMREEEGFVKVLASAEDGKVLGVHIMGAHASDLIAEAALAMKMECTTRDISNTIHAHPTLSEVFLEAVEDCDGMAIHKFGRRR